MRVLKRDGTHEDISFDKVRRRIQMLCKGLGAVDPDSISQRVISRIYDGVRTSELDELAAQMCATLVTDHPDYEVLASRLITSNHHKNTSPSFSEAMGLLYNALDVQGKRNPLISDELWKIVETHKTKLNTVVNYERDYDLDYFGFKTLERSYLMKVDGKIVERPQHMWMRVALGIHGWDLKDAIETYDQMSQRKFTHATPTLFNAGTPRPQMASCFLKGVGDSVTGMYTSLADCAQISKYAGGIGIHISNIRASGSHIRGTNGTSSGIIPFMRVYNNTARHINQGSKRLGSFAIYLEPWHSDVEAFLEVRKNQGNEEERCRDLFTALWVPDLFMRRVEEKADWSLMCPDECPGLNGVYGAEFEALYERYEAEGRFRRKVKAQTLWLAILKSQIETGTPYMLYKDAANRKSNQKNIGVVKSSNLCVAPETRVLTRQGHVMIKEMENRTVDVWNGFEWSEVIVRKTNEDDELIRVNLSDGTFLECTPYHKFYVQNTYHGKAMKVDAQELVAGDKLMKWMPPSDVDHGTEVFKYAYTHGVFSGDGTYHSTYGGEKIIPTVALYNEKKLLLPFLDIYSTSGVEDANGRLNVMLPKDLAKKFTVPMNARLEDKLLWFAGVLDTDGHTQAHVSAPKQMSIGLASVHLSFLREIQMMLQTIGVSSTISLMRDEGEYMLPDGKGGEKLYQCNEIHRLMISSQGVSRLIKAGMKTNRLDLSEHMQAPTDRRHFVKVVSVEWNKRRSATYCFTEPKRNMGVFNGILTGNCTEIIEVSDSKGYATCNLGSIALASLVRKDGPNGAPRFDFAELAKMAGILTKNINKVIDRTYYPVAKTLAPNKLHRPIGIGVQGLADTYAMMRCAFDSPEAAALNREIFETIYYGAVSASVEIAKKRALLRDELDALGEGAAALMRSKLAALATGADAAGSGAAAATGSERAVEIRKHLALLPEEEALNKWRGAYASFAGSPASDGQLQYDLWGLSEKDLSGRWDWASLKEDLARWGMRNSLLVAPMPTASTSQILGYNECFEPFTSNIYQRRTLAGEFTLINKYLIRDLLGLGIWNRELKNKIIAGNGSIQGITEIPEDIQVLYKTAWEIKQRVLLDQSAERGAFVCQSQSLNWFVEDPDYTKLTNMHFYAWKKGLKTGMYYLRTRPKAKAMAFTIDPSMVGNSRAAGATTGTGGSPAEGRSPAAKSGASASGSSDEEPVFACRRDDPECLMCGS